MRSFRVQEMMQSTRPCLYSSEAKDALEPLVRKILLSFDLCVLHRPLATSFEGRHGSVRYWVKAELHRPWLLPVKLKKEFTVFEHIDINTPSLLSPQAGTKEKTLCCWFCTSGPISLSAKIERKGYTPGESIQIFAEIENCSSRVVVPKAAIYQTQAFYAKGKMKEVKQLVANLRGESLSSGKTETWNGKVLKIPPVSPSILDCSIIRVEYSLMVCWSMFSFHCP
ncbi:arrestin domain-containing protein 3-like [Meleagris gallopavo]|uniref:arrestin domain-containing protein 3-like n=1 Tax=Meleagris gallopavo TaxID=9103 RepID=UPI000549D506|nr:arrestin domain-containing protein 3-like [Meleagris gallopavo]